MSASATEGAPPRRAFFDRALFDRDGWRWGVSAIVVLAAHASFLLALRGATPEASPEPPVAVMLDLAPAPAAPPALPQAVAEAPSPPPAPALPPPPEAISSMAPPDVAPPPPLAETPLLEAPPIPTPPEVAIPPKPRPRPPEKRPPAPRPQPRPAPRAEPTPPRPDPLTAAPTTAPPAPAAPSRPAPAPAAPSVEAVASWRSRLAAHLALFKRFPIEAQRRGEQGVVMMRFTMDREGHVLSAAMAKSSGYADLDAEADAWIRRADPMPALPSDIAQSQVALVVPLRFNLR